MFRLLTNAQKMAVRRALLMATRTGRARKPTVINCFDDAFGFRVQVLGFEGIWCFDDVFVLMMPCVCLCLLCSFVCMCASLCTKWIIAVLRLRANANSVCVCMCVFVCVCWVFDN